jgi:hypothetical protein
MTFRNFHVGRAQRVAGLLLLVMLGECLWLVARTPLDSADYRYARCGREMWEQPSALQGYFTSCGNLNGDGTLAYRLAGFPLSLQRWTLLAADHLRKPQNRLYSGGALNGSTWEARHQVTGVKWLLHLPFVLIALWAGGGLWWVARRLFGNEGGALVLALYVFCPAVLRSAVTPNNEILALWALFGLIYTMMGVAHAMQGPRRKWRPRIVLLTIALAATAAAHLLAACVGFCIGTVYLVYLCERRRSHLSQVLLSAVMGAAVLLFAEFGFRLSAFVYVFTGGSVRFWFTTTRVLAFFTQTAKLPFFGNAVMPLEFGTLIATLIALALWLGNRRSRYFGNSAALIVALIFAPLYTTQVFSAPWFWALPFLFTFIGGVFADALETRRRRAMLLLSAALVISQAVLCIAWIASAAG